MTDLAEVRARLKAKNRAFNLARCRHYRGALGPAPCAAGVDLVGRVGPRRTPGWIDRIPCVLNEAPAFVCAAKATPTEAELDAEDRALVERAKRTLEVLAAIPAGKPGDHGTLPCPQCGDTVQWIRSSCNGHLSAACAGGCVSFME